MSEIFRSEIDFFFKKFFIFPVLLIMFMVILIILVSLPLPAFAGPGKHTGYNKQELSRILKASTTDKIMAALEPIIAMDKDKILSEIKAPLPQIIGNTFCLMVSTAEFPEKGEKFLAFYGIPVSILFGIISHTGYLHYLANIEGRGNTPHEALVHLVMKLTEKGLIDPISLVKRLKVREP
jgi:hypothetical protein